jgi:uncharacterized protein (DUF433 family)
MAKSVRRSTPIYLGPVAAVIVPNAVLGFTAPGGSAARVRASASAQERRPDVGLPSPMRRARDEVLRVRYARPVTAMNESPDIYGGASPRDLAFYSPAEAARILQVNQATIRTWAFGRRYDTRLGAQRWPGLIEPADPAHKRLSFRNLVELYVLSVLRGKDGRGSADRVRIDKIRRATERINTAHPFADVDLHTDWVDLYVEFFGALENITDAQQSLRPTIERHLRRIERDDRGLAQRLFPATRDDEDGPRAIVVDPARRFGRPILVSANIETSAISDRFGAGEPLASIARDLQIPVSDVDEAVRFELRYRDAA